MDRFQSYNNSNTMIINNPVRKKKINIQSDIYSFNYTGKKLIINAPISSLTLTGCYNKIILQNTITNLIINGNGNNIKANDNRGVIINVVFNGNDNKIKLNYNASNISQIQNGFNNKIFFNGTILNNNNNMYSSNHQTFNFGNSNFSININGQNDMNFFDPNSLFNLINSSISNLGMNINFGNFNQNNNYRNDNEYNNNFNYYNNNNINYNNFNNNEENLGDYYQEELENEVEEEENENDNENLMKKRANFILEMDEFQYKHILKYSSRKEDSCTICLQKFKGTDIIKEFCCKHIFHKKCLLKWLKTSNNCPLCKHNLMDDLNNI